MLAAGSKNTDVIGAEEDADVEACESFPSS